jgi:cell wall-associated NlpC family hydrolase
LLLGVLLVTLLVSVSAATADPSISSKRAQADAVLAEIREMDSRLAKAIEAYNYANVQLDELETELESNGRHLVVARQSLAAAQEHVAARLRTLYVNGGTGGFVEVVLGASSLDDLLNRLDVIEAVGAQDAQVLKDVRQFRREVEERRARLQKARAAQARVVAERESQKNWIEGQLVERQRLLSSIRDEIARLEAEERRRQARIAAEARARLEAERAAAQAARAAAAEASSQSGSSLQEVGSPSYNASALSDPVQNEVVSSAPPARYGGVVGIAMQYLGVPYVWGGMSPSGFDCSGLIAYAYAQVGVSLPHHAASQYNYGTPVSMGEMQPGDLVFFDGLGHAGIYIGGGQFIHAPHTGDVVKISSISGWYADRWVGARRI